MIAPAVDSSDGLARDIHAIRYEIAVSGSLPAFDPLVTFKQKLLRPKHIRVFNAMVRATHRALFPMFLLGFVLRFPVMFAPAHVGRVLGPISLALKIPIMFQVVAAFRFEFVRVIVGTFEFWFMIMTVTTWIVSFGLYLDDARAAVLPSSWADFVNMLLIETYFQNSKNVVVVASASACYLFALSVGVSLDAIDNVQRLELAQMHTRALTIKDVLVNTMATMIMLLARLSYRKIESLRRQRRAAHPWLQSMGYRCRTELRQVSVNTSSTFNTLPSATTTHAPAQDLVANGVETVEGRQLMRLRFVHVPVVFDAANTVLPRAFSAPLLRLIERRRALFGLLHKGAGIVSAVLIPAHYYLDTSGVGSSMKQRLAIAALCLTLAFWTPLLCCAQRQLATRLWTSFDFLFVYTQLVLSHVAMGDMLSWRPAACCGLLSSFLWIQGVLMIDALPPVTRARLGWRTWFVVPMLLAYMVMQVLVCLDIFGWNRSDLRNRLLLDRTVGRHRVQFYVVPFFVSRQVTIFVWCTRILHRFRTRKSEHELLLLLGNVEYNYEHWRHEMKARAAAAAAAVRPAQSKRQSITHKIFASLTQGRMRATMIVPSSPGGTPSKDDSPAQ